MSNPFLRDGDLQEIIKVVKDMEYADLYRNRAGRDYMKPQPISTNKMKLACFEGISDYLKSDYNITSVQYGKKGWSVFAKKYPLAIQIYYPYTGSDSRYFGKEVVSLWLIDYTGEVIHCKRTV